MTPEQFVYWLQGYTEVAQQAPSVGQWQIIQDHLQTVFKKETPKRVLQAAPEVFTGETPACGETKLSEPPKDGWMYGYKPKWMGPNPLLNASKHLIC